MKVFWEKDVSLKIAALAVAKWNCSQNTWKKLLRGSFLVKPQGSTLMSKKNNKNYAWVKSSYIFVSVIDNPDHFENRFNSL